MRHDRISARAIDPDTARRIVSAHTCPVSAKDHLRMRKRTGASIAICCFFHDTNKMGKRVIATRCFSTFRPVSYPWSSKSLEYCVTAMGLSYIYPRVFLVGWLAAFASGLVLPPAISLPDLSTISPISSNGLQSSPSNNSVSAPGFLSDLTFLNDDASQSAQIKPVCNGSMFGTNLQVNSCWDAMKLIAPDTTSVTFGDRGHGFNIQLPRRYSSCK